MSTIRRQSIISSGIVYLGLALGAVSNLVLAKVFRPDQYGLINGMFVAIGTIMYSFASLGMLGYIGKFYPYYNDNLPAKRNDQMTWVLLSSFAGFLLVILSGFLFKDTVVRYFQYKSAELVKYYYWIFVFGFGMTFYSLLEAYAWQAKKSILTNYLREVQFRLITLALIALYLLGIIKGFDTFLKLYAFNYLFIGLVLMIHLVRSGNLHFVLTPSRVTKRFLPLIRYMSFLTWSGGFVFNLAYYFAQIVIAGVVAGGLTAVGIFTFAQFIGSLVQAPQRGISAAAIGPLSQAWKDKDHGRIKRIYRRSSISQTIFSVGMFALIWINFRDAILTFHLNSDYLAAQPVFLFIGLARLVDMSTGVNAQIIVTSSYWRFDFLSGLILVAITLPLNYILAKDMGVIGPAVADLITFFVYNGIRWIFLYRRFKMQPFTKETIYALSLGLAVFSICYLVFDPLGGLLWMIIRSLTFLILYGAGVLILRLSEDVSPVWQTVKKRLGIVR